MTVSNISLLISLLLCSNFALSQTYHPFPTQNATWSFYTDHGTQSPYTSELQYYVDGDTLIAGNTYAKLYSSSNEPQPNPMWTRYIGGVREDSLKKVWMVPDAFGGLLCTRYGMNDTTEFLLYQFGLQAGDTLQLPYRSDFIVHTVDTILFGGQQRIAYNYSYYGGRPQFEGAWVEGVGDMSELLSTVCQRYMGDTPTLVCYTDDVTAYLNPRFPTCHNLLGVEEEAFDTEVSVYPNPAQDWVQLEITGAEKIQFYELYSLTGREVLSSITNAATRIKMNIASLPSGLYFVHVGTDTGRIFREKLRIE